MVGKKIKRKEAVRLGWIYISWIDGMVSGCSFGERKKNKKKIKEETEENSHKFHKIYSCDTQIY